ncbi:MAG: phage tail tape measure protein, partial [Candidatus Kapabacteria bacterium]|nr:phage tail tape measure protein [Candidatus Kapabacteria bacterium]
MARLQIEISILPKLASGAWERVMSTFKRGATDMNSESSKLFGGLRKQFADGQAIANEGGGMFGDVANRLGQLASPAGIATAALTALTFAFTQTVSIGKEYEKQLAAVGAITGITGKGLDELGSKARSLATSFGGPVTDQLKLFQFTLSKFGPDLAKSPEQLAEVAKNINLLGKAGALDAARSTDAVANSMLQFGVNVSNANVAAKESGRFVNVLAASARVGAAEIGQVTEAVLQAGVSAKQLKLSFEETNAAVQALAIGGKVGSEAGIGLRNVLTSLVTGGEKQQAILQQMGQSYKSLGDSLSRNGLSATLGLLRDGMNKLSTDAERSAALAALFGKENLASAGILLDQVETIKRWTKEITGTNDALMQASINMNTFDDRLKRLTANIEDYAIGAYQKLGPALNKTFDFIANSISQASPSISPVWMQQLQQIEGAFGGLYESLKPILAVLGGQIVGSVILQITAALNGLNVAFTIVGQVAKGVGEILSPIGVALGIIDANATKATDPLQTFTGILSTAVSAIASTGKTITDFSAVIIKYLVMPVKWAVGVGTDFTKWLLSISPAANVVGGSVQAMSSAFAKTSRAMLAGAESSQRFVEQQIQANKEQQKSAQTTSLLVREYQNLASQKKLTGAETKRLYEIQQTLDKQYPSLIDQTTSFRDNLSGVAEIGKQTTSSMTALAKQSEQLQKQLEAANRNIAYAKRNVAIDELRDSLGSFSLFGIGDENKFREQFAQAREIYVSELFGAKTSTEVLSAQAKIFEKLNDLNKQGLFKDNRKIAELYEMIGKAATASQQAIGDVNEEVTKSVVETQKSVKGTVSLDAVLDKTKKRSDKAAKEAAKTQLDIFKDELKAAKEAAELSEQNLRAGLAEKA